MGTGTSATGGPISAVREIKAIVAGAELPALALFPSLWEWAPVPQEAR